MAMLKQYFSGLLVGLSIITANVSWAVEEKNTQLFLMIQAQGEPLFKPVDLKIYRLEKLANKQLIYKSTRHTAALNLPAGSYMAQINFQNRLVRQLFQLVSHEDRYVAIEVESNKSTLISTR
jgi:hypothetical protein